MEIEKLSFSDQRIAKAISYIKVQTSLSEKFIIKRMKRLKKIFDSMEWFHWKFIWSLRIFMLESYIFQNNYYWLKQKQKKEQICHSKSIS